MAGTLVQDGKLLYEMGRLDEAEHKLKSAATNDPSNQAAYYYLKLIAEARYQNGARDREVMNKDKIVEMEKAWLPSTQREKLPTPNPKADVYIAAWTFTRCTRAPAATPSNPNSTVSS